MKKNICILIPAYNEAANVGRLVESLLARSLDVVVIDDGSSDGTGRMAQDKGATVLVNHQNHGKGFSLQKGFDHIISKGYDELITMDGDGQHAVEDLELFLKRSETEGADIICGNRMSAPQGMPFIRWATNWTMSWLISAVCRQRVNDTQCGYRLIKCDVLKNIVISSTAFEIESEVLIKAAKKGYRIASVPVKSIYAGQQSRINPFFDTVRFIVYIIRELFVR